jgi:hypothetical protein
LTSGGRSVCIFRLRIKKSHGVELNCSHVLNYHEAAVSRQQELWDAHCTIGCVLVCPDVPCAGSRRVVKGIRTSAEIFLFLFCAGYSFLFPSLSDSASILKESGKHYFVIRGPFSLHTCWMTLQPSEITSILLNSIVKLQ